MTTTTINNSRTLIVSDEEAIAQLKLQCVDEEVAQQAIELFRSLRIQCVPLGNAWWQAINWIGTTLKDKKS